MLTPSDRVVVRDLASSDEVEIVTSPAPTDYASPSAVSWAGYSDSGALFALTVDGDLRAIDPAGSSVLQDHPVVASAVDGFPVGVLGESVLVNVTGDEGAVELFSIDTTTGDRSLLASSERFFDIGVDPESGAVLAAGFGEITAEAGAPVTVLEVPDGWFVSALDW